MSAELRPIEVPRCESASWMEESLQQGFDISSAMLAALKLEQGHFFVLAPDNFARNPLRFAVGGVTKTGLAEEALSNVLDEMCSKGAQSIVVEDNLMEATDPVVAKRDEPLAFVGNRILHWCDLQNGGNICARTVMLGASGFPLNAFVSTCTPAELGLADRKPPADNIPQLILEHLAAVVIAAFDAESFLIWTKADNS